MGERQRVMIARALSTAAELAAGGRADRQPRHPAQPRSARAAARAVPRAQSGDRARQPRPARGRLRRPRVRAARRQAVRLPARAALDSARSPLAGYGARRVKPETSCTSTACACAHGWCRSSSPSSGSRRAWRCCSPPRWRARASRARSRSFRAGSSATRPCSCWRATRRACPRACWRGSRRSPAFASLRRCWKRAPSASGPKGSESVELVGADSSLRQLGGALVRHTELEPFADIGAVLLPAPLAEPPRRDQVRQGSDAAAVRQQRACAAVRAAARKADRRPGGEPDRRRAAVLRPGNDRPDRARLAASSCSRPRAWKRQVRAALRAPGGRTLERASPPATTKGCSPRQRPRATSRRRCSR